MTLESDVQILEAGVDALTVQHAVEGEVALNTLLAEMRDTLKANETFVQIGDVTVTDSVINDVLEARESELGDIPTVPGGMPDVVERLTGFVQSPAEYLTDDVKAQHAKAAELLDKYRQVAPSTGRRGRGKA